MRRFVVIVQPTPPYVQYTRSHGAYSLGKGKESRN